MNITTARLAEFIKTLRECGGRSGNKSLRTKLGWTEDFYSKVQQKLVADGQIRSGPGYGGTVYFPEERPDVTERPTAIPAKERELYGPLKEQIELHWAPSRGYHDFIIEETHSQGSRSTGGTYSRPDITVIGVKKYLYLPTSLEAVTFEIKPKSSVSVIGVLEALTHRESSHKSYVIYDISSDDFDSSDEAPRILALAQRHGIGLILVDDPKDFDTWDIRLQAQWTSPDPDRLDSFINALADSSKKQRIQKTVK